MKKAILISSAVLALTVGCNKGDEGSSGSSSSGSRMNEPAGAKWYYAECTDDVSSHRLYLRERIFGLLANSLSGK